MTQNVLIFNNQTVAPVQFILYLSDPQQAVQTAVVWQQMFAPPKVPAPLTWTDDWSATFATFADDILTPVELKPTFAGQRWQIALVDEQQQLLEAGGAPPDYVEIANTSGKRANAGIGLSGSGAVYVRDLLSNAMAGFKLTSLDYWVALPALPVQSGQIIDPSQFLMDPVRLSGPVAATLTLTGPPLQITVSHTVGEPAALLRAARLLK
jgi:hypothetical protein